MAHESCSCLDLYVFAILENVAYITGTQTEKHKQAIRVEWVRKKEKESEREREWAYHRPIHNLPTIDDIPVSQVTTKWHIFLGDRPKT